MPKKKRRYNPRLIKRARSYTVQEVARLFNLHQNAVHRWMKEGLPRIDGQKPYLIHGADLFDFLNIRQSKRKHTCQPTEMYCCKCRKPQAIWELAVDVVIRNPKQLTLRGLCAICSSQMNKAGSVKKLAEYEKTFNVQTLAGEHLIERNNPPVNRNLKRMNES